jgi:hypothetical protein
MKTTSCCSWDEDDVLLDQWAEFALRFVSRTRACIGRVDDIGDAFGVHPIG